MKTEYATSPFTAVTQNSQFKCYCLWKVMEKPPTSIGKVLGPQLQAALFVNLNLYLTFLFYLFTLQVLFPSRPKPSGLNY